MADNDCAHEGPYHICGCVFDDCGICIEPGEAGVARSETQGILSNISLLASHWSHLSNTRTITYLFLSISLIVLLTIC